MQRDFLLFSQLLTYNSDISQRGILRTFLQPKPLAKIRTLFAFLHAHALLLLRQRISSAQLSLLLFRWNKSSWSALSSVARRGWKPPMWLFLASPGGENFAGLETAPTRNCGSFWTFLIFINKITK